MYCVIHSMYIFCHSLEIFATLIYVESFGILSSVSLIPASSINSLSPSVDVSFLNLIYSNLLLYFASINCLLPSCNSSWISWNISNKNNRSRGLARPPGVSSQRPHAFSGSVWCWRFAPGKALSGNAADVADRPLMAGSGYSLVRACRGFPVITLRRKQGLTAVVKPRGSLVVRPVSQSDHGHSPCAGPAII